MKNNLTTTRQKNESFGFGKMPTGLRSFKQLLGGLSYRALPLFFVFAATFAFQQNAQAQFACSCNDFNLPLNADGEATVTPSMVVSNEADPDCDPSMLTVRLLDANGDLLVDVNGDALPQDEVRCNHVGETIMAEVLDDMDNVVCWSNANIEDKMGPSCEIDDLTLECTEYRNPYVVRNDSASIAGPITVTPGLNSSVPVPMTGYGRITDVNVYVDAEAMGAADLADLRLELRFPQGTGDVVDIVMRDPNCAGETIINATFDDEFPAYDCTGGITDRSAPAQPLSVYDGLNKSDTWRVRFQNTAASGNIVLNDVRIEVAYDLLPVVIDNCSEIPTYEYDDVEDLECNNNGTIERTWTVTDPGGMTTECSHTITIELNSAPQVAFPRDTFLSCIVDQADLDPDDMEQYNNGGAFYDEPRYEGNEDYCGNLASTYTDEIYDICLPYSYKIRRAWKVRDWCDPDFLEEDVQVIKVEDLEAPMITAPDTVRYTVPHNECELDVDLPEVQMNDNCDADPTSSVILREQVTGTNFPGGINVPTGIYDAIYTASDACGNERWDTIVVIITDDVEPVPICDRNTNITLTSRGSGTDLGWATVCWQTIDDESYDNCELEEILISKTGEPGTFQECLTYTCDEVGENEIFLGVWDVSGNFSSCWGFLYVEDKVQPRLTCERDTIYCTDDINRELQRIVDSTEAEWEAQGLIQDNCDNTSLICTDFVFEGDDCNPSYIRTCYAEDQYGNQSLSCEHRVVELDTTAWRVVSFPADVPDLPCNSQTDPSRTGEPVVDYDCEHIGVRFEDAEYNLCGNSPNIQKIQRTWYVTDWCTGTDITHVQEIIQGDDVAPGLTIPADFNADINTNDCEVTVPVNVSAVDDCGLAVTITNDFNNQIVSGAGTMVFTLPKGVHEIQFRAEDACGNVTIEDLTITVEDVKAPTARCSDITVNIKSTGIVSVDADLLDAGSDDNCTDQPNLIFLIQRLDENGDPVGTAEEELIFDCDDVADPDSTHMVQLVVVDDSGNRQECVTTVTVTDNDDVCGGGMRFATVAGYVLTSSGDPIEDASVDVSAAGIDDAMTTSTGQFVFAALATGNEYELTVSKEDDFDEGLNTLDLILIRRHILRLDYLDDAYQYIAADANNDERVNTLDIANLRALILRLADDLPNGNTSWRFVDGTYAFPNPDNPWEETIPEFVSSDMLYADNMGLQLIGIKVGDVDNSFMSSRSSEGEFDVKVDNKSFASYENFAWSIPTASMTDLMGTQFTLKFDTDLIEFVSLNEAQVSESNIGLSRVDEGYITLSWDNMTAVEAEDWMSLNFKALTSGNMSEAIEINSEITEAEAYDATGRTSSIDFDFNTEVSGAFQLYQNVPNPFSNETSIGFYLPQDDVVTVKVIDIAGMEVFRTEANFSQGMNEVTLNSSDLKTAGIYYYQVETGASVATKKLVFFDK